MAMRMLEYSNKRSNRTLSIFLLTARALVLVQQSHCCEAFSVDSSSLKHPAHRQNSNNEAQRSLPVLSAWSGSSNYLERLDTSEEPTQPIEENYGSTEPYQTQYQQLSAGNTKVENDFNTAYEAQYQQYAATNKNVNKDSNTGSNKGVENQEQFTQQQQQGNAQEQYISQAYQTQFQQYAATETIVEKDSSSNEVRPKPVPFRTIPGPGARYIYVEPQDQETQQQQTGNGDQQNVPQRNQLQNVVADMNVEKDFNAATNTGVQNQEQVTQQQQGPTEEPYITKEDQERFLKMVSNEVQVKRFLNQNPYALTDIPVDVMIQRFLDNAEDSFQKKNGKFKGQSRLKGKDSPAAERPTVVVLGTGWAAHAFIKVASTYDLRVVVVSPVNHFVFTPMLASAAVGTVEYRSMTEPIRVTNPFIDNYVEGRAIGIDVAAKKLSVRQTALGTVTGAFKGVASNAPGRLEPESKETEGSGAGTVIKLNYDYLICAVGTTVRSSMVPGAKEHCFNLKTSQDSKRLRTAIGEALEYASRPDVSDAYYCDSSMMYCDVEQQMLAREERKRRVRFVIVGGGPTGVELAGELSDLIRQVCRKPDGAYQRLADDVSIVLVHGGNCLLPMMNKDLREKALSSLKAQGVELRLNTRLKEVGRDFVRLGKKGSDEEETIPVGLTCWAAGNAPAPFVAELLSQLPESAAGPGGRINVDKWLRCPTPTPENFGSILVLGDVAYLEGEHKYGPAAGLPQTAQVAGQQGAFTARMLNRGYNLRETPPRLPEVDPFDELSLLRVWLLVRGLEEAPEFNFLSLGLLAYVGGGEALNQVELGDVPVFDYSGAVAFVLWKSVYLAKQAATRNQALIAFDWWRTELFGRDITRL